MGCGCSKKKVTPVARKKEKTSPYNIVDVAKDYLAGDVKLVEEDTKQKRTEVCRSCEFLLRLPGIGTGQCKKCGCVIDLKVKYAKSFCPVYKW